MDELIQQYADVLQHIYDGRLAGDYTFHGVLFEFSRKAKTIQEQS